MILNKNIFSESAEDPRTPIPRESTQTQDISDRSRSAMLVASLQLSASKTLLSVFRSQLTSSSNFQSLHLFSCSSIENGIIFGSILSNSLSCLYRLFEFPDILIHSSAVRVVQLFGEFLSTLRRQNNFLLFKEIQLFVDEMTSQLEEIFRLWIQMIQKEKFGESVELLRDCLTSIVRYGTRETCQSLQFVLHTKLQDDKKNRKESSDSSPVEIEDHKRREFTRGLLLCAQRSYVESLQIIATSAGDATFVKIEKESGGSLGGLLSLSLHGEGSSQQSERDVISNWISHLSGISGVQKTSLESFYSPQRFTFPSLPPPILTTLPFSPSSLIGLIHSKGMPKVFLFPIVTH